MTNRYDGFLRKYCATAKVGEARTFTRYVAPSTVASFSEMTAMDVLEHHFKTYHDTVLTIEIPSHKFNEIVRQDEYVEHLERTADYNQGIVNMLRKDERVREDNPAVAKAYRNYLTLLELARK
jgi:hypothetical protein